MRVSQDTQFRLGPDGWADGGIFPSSITRTPLRPGSRRASIASRTGSYSHRPSMSYHRPSSSQVELASPSSGVFHVDTEDDEPGPSTRPAPHMGSSFASIGSVPKPRASVRRHGSRRNRRTSSAAQGSYFAYQPGGPTASPDESTGSPTSPLSPARASTAFGKIASYIGFNRGEQDEEAGLSRGRRSTSDYSGRGSERSRSSGERSLSPTSSEGWGYKDDEEWSDRPEGEEGYTSSLADDTSLPPQSRPQSPHLPLIPNSTDAVFGESGRGAEYEEPKDFVSVEVPSRQTILLPDEDLSIRFTGYRTDQFRRTLWLAGCVCTLGGLGLLGRWTPSIWVRFCGREVSFEEAKDGSWVMVEVS